MVLDDKQVNPDVTVDGSVAAAMTLAAELECLPTAVAATADPNRVRPTGCQLGLFGYPGHAKRWEAAGVAGFPAPAGLDEVLLASRNEAGEPSCLAVWSAAQSAGCVADRNGIKIRGCQLGAF